MLIKVWVCWLVSWIGSLLPIIALTFRNLKFYRKLGFKSNMLLLDLALNAVESTNWVQIFIVCVDTVEPAVSRLGLGLGLGGSAPRFTLTGADFYCLCRYSRTYLYSSWPAVSRLGLGLGGSAPRFTLTGADFHCLCRYSRTYLYSSWPAVSRMSSKHVSPSITTCFL